MREKRILRLLLRYEDDTISAAGGSVKARIHSLMVIAMGTPYVERVGAAGINGT